jgi:hypothetical protein
MVDLVFPPNTAAVPPTAVRGLSGEERAPCDDRIPISASRFFGENFIVYVRLL